MSELDAGLPQVSKVLSALRETKMQVVANSSCGMHVHVGVEGGMRLMHAKKVFTLAALLDQPVMLSGARAGIALHLREPGQGKCRLDVDDSSSDEESSGEDKRPDFDFEGTQSTYEFRFPQMSFDKDFIKHWAELVCKIIELAMLPAPQFAALLERVSGVLEEIEDAKGEGLEKIWPVLNLQHQIPFWHAQLERHKRGEFISHVDARGTLRP
ncbi:hypothetical protein HRG_005225 [Hirsutella rhossiliensis]|uniref:Uncharacterized protein n=1 Tax=Hirsutella rhossiliensis TaxID=111463 RepID=A0A9P8MWW1_9HYPO|nr:uncharacterized protein HRG_05225 [Hirsutella rhossiliensis]KAH0962715.1 hypothetical protein HRG_05225 [Hirsutella rhossiliensis]